MNSLLLLILIDSYCDNHQQKTPHFCKSYKYKYRIKINNNNIPQNSTINMNNISWYMCLYYKYRQYPAQQINRQYKKTQLRAIYNNMMMKLSSYFEIDYNGINGEYYVRNRKQMGKEVERMKMQRKSNCSLFTMKDNDVEERKPNRQQKQRQQQIDGQSNNNINQHSQSSHNTSTISISKLQTINNNTTNILLASLDLVANTSNQIIMLIVHRVRKSKIVFCGRFSGKQSKQQNRSEKDKECREDGQYQQYQQANSQDSETERGSEQGSVYSKVADKEGDKDRSRYREMLKLPQNSEEIRLYFMDYCANIEISEPSLQKSFKDLSNQSLEHSIQQQVPVNRQFHSHFNSNKQYLIINDNSNQLSKFSQSIIVSHKQYTQSQPQEKLFEQMLYRLYKKELPNFTQYISWYSSSSPLFQIDEQLWCHNYLLQTWVQLLFMQCSDPQILYQIVLSIAHKQHINAFVNRIYGYLYFIVFIRTRKLLLKVLSKYNCLLQLIEVFRGELNLKGIRLTEKDGVLYVWDIVMDRDIFDESVMEMFVTEVVRVTQMMGVYLSKDSEVFWGDILQKCIEMLDGYLCQQISLIYSLLTLNEKLQSEKQSQLITKHSRNLLKLTKQLLSSCSSFTQTHCNITKKSVLNIKSQKQSNNSQHSVSALSIPLLQAQQLRQYQHSLQQQTQKLSNYNYIIDCGLKIFDGNTICVAGFIYDTYSKLNDIVVDSKEMEMNVIVREYCEIVEQIVDIEKGEKLRKKVPDIREMECHAGYYAVIGGLLGKRVRDFRKRDKFQKLEKNYINDTNINSINNTQSNYLQQHSININPHPAILQLSTIQNIIQEPININKQQQKVLTQLNQYLQLVNMCNMLVFNAKNLLMADQVLGEAELRSQYSHSQTLLHQTQTINSQDNQKQQSSILLTTQQLKADLQSYENQQYLLEQRTMATMKRTLSNTLARNSLLQSQNLIQSLHGQPTTINYSKMCQKMQAHNKCLSLLLLLYKKCKQYTDQFCTNIICQQCLQLFSTSSNHCIHTYNSTISSSNHIKNDSQTINNRNVRRELSIMKMHQWIGQYKNMHMSKHGNYFQRLLALQSYYLKEIEGLEVKIKLLRLYSLLASFGVSADTYKNIQRLDLSVNNTNIDNKYERVRVLGRKYYQQFHQMLQNHANKPQTESLASSKKSLPQSSSQIQQDYNNYKFYFLIIITSSIQLVYTSSSTHNQTLYPFINILNKYFTDKTQNIARNMHKQQEQEQGEMLNFNKFIEQIFQWGQINGNKEEEEGDCQVFQKEDQFIKNLIQIRVNQNSSQQQHILKNFDAQIEKSKKFLTKFQTQKQQIDFLCAKLFYLILRQMYFYMNYNCSLFENKPNQAAKNYQLYEKKMMDFFREISDKDLVEFRHKRKEELKERSKFLGGYLANYQEEPIFLEEERICYIRIVCIFDRLLSLITQNMKLEMKKRSTNPLCLVRKKSKQPIYMHYVSKQYLKPNGKSVRVLDLQNYNFYQAIRIYDSMAEKKNAETKRKYSTMKELRLPANILQYSLDRQQMQFIQKNKQSLLALWINQQCCTVFEKEIHLSQKAFLLKIQKLYVDLDVRHKVFESFKDKILSYEMQKTKIYHQYMDYIRGLKLDVYSHVAGEDPVPYFKFINAIKLYRLNIKEKQMKEKVEEEFGKNLGKWNQGITVDIQKFETKLQAQKKLWENKYQQAKKHKKQLCEIQTIILKQFDRQQIKNLKNKQKIAPILKSSKKLSPMLLEESTSHKNIRNSSKHKIVSSIPSIMNVNIQKLNSKKKNTIFSESKQEEDSKKNLKQSMKESMKEGKNWSYAQHCKNSKNALMVRKIGKMRIVDGQQQHINH